MPEQTVYVKSENKGLRIVVGAIFLLFWARYWWLGDLREAITFHSADGKFNSATGPLIELAANILWGVGSLIIWALSMGWFVVKDVATGLYETLAKKIADVRAARAVSVQAPEPAPHPRRAIDEDKLAGVLQSHDDRISALESTPRKEIAFKRSTRQRKPPKDK